ncbi:beta-ketoacyl synthase N-terminal-like domain-containing protein [Geoalkalibacter halelectricus]|uniref:Beta-ketoacyl synthase chain length factor n=1 Tax=Geoalkalibacter halelectricus TaxID=2847045 RepID=A0ABY5ZQ72_9BACT|nr:beta-ketoacyl synthase N-terminal-like domain-containing protein [Geoalkalibacter halelectricus]MDO3379829.1 beta-ketoacyl synthase chain length factor [Geoalkalibacter halelectricus]UWZ80639.1 beta-ketoacyl synthase chain length factor [Geoalkalibacter halelectricus]
MIRLAIQGVGVLGGFGCGLGDLEKRLMEGVPAFGSLIVPVEGQELNMAAYTADSAPLERFVNKRATRRIDHFSRMALLGACLALEDAGELESSMERVGVVIASGYGPTRTTFSFLDSVFDGGDACASPTNFSNSVHNAAAAHVAIQLKAGGPSLTVSQFEMSVCSALMTTQLWLAEGRVDKVLFGAVDELCSVLGYCWGRFFPGGESMIDPFSLDRQTAIPGEGAAFFLLTRDEQARYGHVSQIRQESIQAPLSSGETYLLNLDGHAGCSTGYRQVLPGSASVAVYTPYYGSLPVGQAFDLAVAAMALRDGRLPGANGFAGPADPGWQLAQGALDRNRLICLKCDGRGRVGHIRVEKS